MNLNYFERGGIGLRPILGSETGRAYQPDAGCKAAEAEGPARVCASMIERKYIRKMKEL
jgi:hypothetical protein